MSLLDKYFEKYYEHHAHLIEGNVEWIASELINFLIENKVLISSHDPDLYVGEFDILGMNDGRMVQDFISKKPFRGEKKIIILKTNFITHETQNSLLKTFEEPTASSFLFLLMPSTENLLATLHSRLNFFRILDEDDFENKFVEEFLKSNLSKRLDLIKKFLPQKTDEKVNKTKIISFLNNLESVLYQKFANAQNLMSSKEKGSATDLSAMVLTEELSTQTMVFEEIRQCRSYLNDRAPSVKMILEHLSQII
ncbi:MAG: hypothetical protein V1851_00035 [Patescibacteria group bacterium]